MQRRTLLKTFGSIGAATAIGGAGVLASSGGAQATAGSSIADPAAVTSDDGTISYVSLQTTGRVNWDGFDEPVAKARIMNYVEFKRNGSAVWGENLIHDTGKFSLDSDNDGSGGPRGGEGEEVSLTGDHEAGQEGYIASDVDWGIAQKQKNGNNVYNNGYGLPNNPAPVSPLAADDDGSSQSTRIVLRAVYILYDENGNELTGQEGYPERPEATSDFVVEINNQQSSTSFGGTDAQGDDEDSAEVGVNTQTATPE